MYFSNTLRILGMLIMGFSVSFLIPIFVALLYREKTIPLFLECIGISLLTGFILWFLTRKETKEVKAKEGFLIVTLLWIVLSFISTLPFLLSDYPSFSIADAIFESISGLTTTGASVFTNLDHMPRSLLYFRQQLQFIGGGGIILLSIAIMPMLGVGGMQLFRADIPGPFKDEKMTPRIAQTAKTLWYIYVGLVLLCVLSYWSVGMQLFDAVGYAFSTVSTGGFSVHDQSFANYKNYRLHIVAIIFMFLGAVNFSLHFTAIRRGNLQHYWYDPEFRTYLLFILSLTLLVASTLYYFKTFDNPTTTFIEVLFQITTFCTTTGLSSANYSSWPTYIPVLFMMLGLIGGCAGSTAGGLKIIRMLLLKKQGFREIQRLIHPRGHYVIKLGYSLLHHRTLDALWGFFGVFVATSSVLLLVLMAAGLDFLTAFSALAASVSNSGLGLGKVSDNFKSINDTAKYILSVAMLLGRLEFFTLLVLLTPSYWKQ